MKCLSGHIGLRGCGLEFPAAAAFLNELPGISLKTIDQVADQEQKTYYAVFQDIETRALRKFSTDVENYLSKKYRLSNTLETINLGDGVDVNDTTAAANEYRGVYGDVVYGSQLQSVYVQEVKIYALAAKTNVEVVVKEYSAQGIWYDRYTKTVDLAEGWNTFLVGLSFTGRRIFIGYNANGITSPELKLQNNCYYGWYCCDINISGAKTNFTGLPVKGIDTYGLSVVLSNQCTYDAYVCNNKNRFTQALLNLYGIEYCTERIHSTRLNFTTLTKDNATKLRDELTALYANEMDSVLSSVEFDCDCCIDCDSVVTYRERIP
jgi:hypothetical protein